MLSWPRLGFSPRGCNFVPFEVTHVGTKFNSICYIYLVKESRGFRDLELWKLVASCSAIFLLLSFITGLLVARLHWVSNDPGILGA